MTEYRVEGPRRGAIRHREAYERGKNLDHSGWQTDGRVVRLITPSDIDMAVDAAGSVVLVEISSSAREWGDIKSGQRRLYESLVLDSRKHCAVLLKHSVPLFEDRLINTWHDVDAFQVMLWTPVRIGLTRVFEGSRAWQRFADSWLRDPGLTRMLCVPQLQEAP